MAVIRLIEIRQEGFRRIVIRTARRRAVDLPEILEPRRIVDDLPVGGIAALPLAVVHDRDARTDRMHQLRRSRVRIAVARRVKYVEETQQIIGARQIVLLIPGKVAEIEQTKTAIADHQPDRFEILRRGS